MFYSGTSEFPNRCVLPPAPRDVCQSQKQDPRTGCAPRGWLRFPGPAHKLGFSFIISNIPILVVNRIAATIRGGMLPGRTKCCLQDKRTSRAD